MNSDNILNYNLIRSKRKTIVICIADGQITVKAPLQAPQNYIQRFVESKKDWIKQKVTLSAIRKKQKQDFFVSYKSPILLLGKTHIVEIGEKKKLGFIGESFFASPNLSHKQIMSFCIKHYRVMAKKYLNERVNIFLKTVGVMPSAVKITGAKTRWGSCSAKKNISFSWRLMMADPKTVDYVIVHELAHLKVMNHSKKFWSIVETVLPDYKKQRADLRLLEKKLNQENWD
ncbi:MAG: M48 family metallopeptidase [Firmicutes bacterium]|nr:M48 family metallopeptidase [Bacillota bacterium]